MKKNKILFLVQLPPPVHGASLMNKLLAESELLNNKYHIDTIPIQLSNKMEGLGNFSLGKIFGACSIYFKLLGKLLFNKYDLVYFTLSPLGFAFYKDAISVCILKIFRKNIVLHLHGKGIKNEIENKLKRRIYKFVFKNVEVIQLAEALKNDIQDIYPKTPYFLPNGVKKNDVVATERTNTIPTFIYLSNLMKDKGILVFLEAIRNLKEYDNQFKVHIVGPSSDVTIEQLEVYISQNKLTNVKLFGPAFNEKKYEHLLKSDVFVLPTYYKNECFPLSILEAYQTGLVVLSTDNGAIPSMVQENKNGFLVPQRDVEALAERMRYLIKNPQQIETIKENNKKEFNEKYTEEIFIHNFETIIDDILAKH
jgi:glycosyltransferase involved in cell wall biosynthesis|tara:strand:- start:18370 stop:19467 length:1098 start_codon:yes stop_codon:yes gene_type:complete